MKKLLCAVLLVATAAFAFAEVDLGGDFMFGVTDIGTSSASSNLINAQLKFNATVDENTSVSVELDAEGTDWSGQAEVVDDPATVDVDEFKEYAAAKNISLDDFRVKSNLTGALGLDAVDVVVTAGLFDVYHTNWNYVSRSGEEFYSSSEAGSYLWTAGPTTDFSANIAIGYSDYTLQYWQNFTGTNMSVAFSGAPVEGLNFLVGYASAFSAIADGSVWVDGGYSFEAGAASLFIPAAFTYDLGDSLYGWSSGVAADIDAYHVAVGVGGNATSGAFKDCLVEVSTSVVENADIYVIGDLDFSADTAFQSVDLGGSYKFGAFKVGAGYVVASGEDVSTSVWSGSTSMSGSGAYIYMDVDL